MAFVWTGGGGGRAFIETDATFRKTSTRTFAARDHLPVYYRARSFNTILNGPEYEIWMLFELDNKN